MSRPLVVAAHGCADPAGRTAIEECALAAGALVGVEPRVGYVDVCSPELRNVLVPGAVVVPLFLASGYHVRHDVPTAAAGVRDVVVTPAIGAVPAVVEALDSRLREAIGRNPVTRAVDAVILASAGSSQAGARAEVVDLGRLLGARIGLPVRAAYLSGPGPTVQDSAAGLRSDGLARLAVVSHLLAPGVFLARAHRLGSDVGAAAVTDGLAGHPAISTLVAARYAAAAMAAA